MQVKVMEERLRVKVSRYMSYLLRHNPEGLVMDEYGFVDLDKLIEKIKQRFRVDKNFVLDIVEKSGRKRFEIVENKIRALYGHTIPVKFEFEEDKTVKVLYHGTTPHAASKILMEGLKPMKRRWVHLSPTIEIAMEVGMRRTDKPAILEIDAEAARKDGLKFFKATDKVYLCKSVPQKYVRLVKADA
jgi:putative RNA 2'-phosphotransferase